MDTLSTGWIQSAAVEEQKSEFRDFPLPFVMYKRIASSLQRRRPTSTSTMEDDRSTCGLPLYKLFTADFVVMYSVQWMEDDSEIHNHFCKSQDFRISFTISFYIPRYNPRGIKLGKLINI